MKYQDRCRYSTKSPFRKWLHRNSYTIIALVIIICICSSYVVLAATIKHQNKELKNLRAYVERYNIVTTINITEPEPYYFEVPLDSELQDYTRELCSDYNVPMALVIAVMDHESSFKADAISKTDDYGLMQINKCNHKTFTNTFGYTDFLNPKTNIHCGVIILSQSLITTDNNIEKALMRYNMGPSGAKKKWNQGIYSTEYSKVVYDLYTYYSALEANNKEKL